VTEDLIKRLDEIKLLTRKFMNAAFYLGIAAGVLLGVTILSVIIIIYRLATGN
jgi:hypothetical protein